MTGVANRSPRSGRIQRENRDYFNEADWLEFLRRHDAMWQAEQHGALVLTVRATIDVDVSTFGIQVPAGRRLTVFSRSLSLTEGVYDVDVLRSENGFTGGTQGTHSKLVDDAPDEVGARVFSGVTIDGAATVKEALFADVGSAAGIGRTAGAPAIDDVIKQYTEPYMIRIQRETGGSAYTAALQLVVWESDA